MGAVKGPSRTRREQAAETRERIVRAAIEVFGERGYTGARMADIASRAGVAVQTVYFAFHTKPDLLRACYEYAVLGPAQLPPPLQPFWAKVQAARTGRAALHEFVVGNADIVERAAVVDEVARAASHEPDVVTIRNDSEQLRRRGYRELLAGVADRFGLSPHLDLDTATDLLLVLAGPQVWLALKDNGWTREQYIAWASDAVAVQLLAKPGRRPG